MKSSSTTNWPEWLKAFGVAVTPFVVAAVGYLITDAQKEREISLKYVEIAITVLREPPSKQNTALRKWAVRLIDHHASIKLSSEAKEELELAPFKGFVFSYSTGTSRPMTLEEHQRGLDEFVKRLTKKKTDQSESK